MNNLLIITFPTQYELNASDQSLGNSVAILVSGVNVLQENSDGTFTVTATTTAEDFWNYCPEERYSQQPIFSNAFAFCSGFLLSNNPPWLGTAAHCIDPTDNSDVVVIFGFEMLSQNNARLTFAANAVYTIESTVLRGVPTGGADDYGIFELDRTVSGYTPYTSINNGVSIGDTLVLIGHPTGLPKKTDSNGQVRNVNSDLIRGTVDSYGGNSGSPVFDGSGRLAGILVGGAPDFVDDGGCDVSNVCPGGPGCQAQGESIVPICELATANSQVSSTLNFNCGGSPPPPPPPASSFSTNTPTTFTVSFSPTSFSSFSSFSSFTSFFSSFTSFFSSFTSFTSFSSSSNSSSSGAAVLVPALSAFILSFFAL